MVQQTQLIKQQVGDAKGVSRVCCCVCCCVRVVTHVPLRTVSANLCAASMELSSFHLGWSTCSESHMRLNL